MKNLISFSLAITVLAFSIVGCSKGSAGPAGPAGPAGAAGPDSVLHSAWIQLSMTLNVDASNDSIYTQTISAPAITDAVLDSGLVLSYMQNLFATDGSIVDVSDYSSFLDITYNTGVINITSFIGDLTGAAFSYIIIPGKMLGSSVFKQYTKTQIRAMDFATLTKLVSAANAKASSN